MKNYLKHLANRLSKVAWLVFIWGFTAIVITLLLSEKDNILSDNGPLIYFGLWIFIGIVFSVANYQPYKEYKDGL
jgi:uncharacterized membrane protein YiaA